MLLSHKATPSIYRPQVGCKPKDQHASQNRASIDEGLSTNIEKALQHFSCHWRAVTVGGCGRTLINLRLPFNKYPFFLIIHRRNR